MTHLRQLPVSEDLSFFPHSLHQFFSLLPTYPVLPFIGFLPQDTGDSLGSLSMHVLRRCPSGSDSFIFVNLSKLTDER